MKLTILGSGTSAPSKNRGNSGYLLEIGADKILIDGGAGTIRKLPLIGVSIWDITKIFYSHLHIDHTLDLIPLLFAYTHPSSFPKNRHKVEIFAHKDFKAHYNALKNVYGKLISCKKVDIVLKAIRESSLNFRDYTVKTAPALHTPQSIAFRFETPDNKSLVYSGDTDYCSNLVSLAKNCNLLLAECSLPDEMAVKGHMTPKSVARLINETRPKQTIITHIYPENDDPTLINRIKTRKNIPVKIAEDLQQVDI